MPFPVLESQEHPFSVHMTFAIRKRKLKIFMNSMLTSLVNARNLMWFYLTERFDHTKSPLGIVLGIPLLVTLLAELSRVRGDKVRNK